MSRATASLGSGGLGRFLEGWWSDYARSLRRRRRTERTIGAYRRSYEDFWRFQLGQGLDDPAKVTRDDVNRWTDNLTSRSRRDGRRGALTPQTVAILWRNARPFFAWWASEEDAPNPFANADRPPEGDHSPDVIHLDDIRALVAACKGRGFDDLHDEAIIRVMFDTGTRRVRSRGAHLRPVRRPHRRSLRLPRAPAQPRPRDTALAADLARAGERAEAPSSHMVLNYSTAALHWEIG